MKFRQRDDFAQHRVHSEYAMRFRIDSSQPSARSGYLALYPRPSTQADIARM